MSLSAETYTALFKLAEESRRVKTAAFWPRLWNVIKNPAFAYGLGAAGMGVGIPVAHYLGVKSKEEDLEQARQQAFNMGLSTGQAEQPPQAQMNFEPASYDDYGYGDYMPDENAMAQYGLSPGVNDTYDLGDYPDFGSFDNYDRRVG
jgi:hypothetical protein